MDVRGPLGLEAQELDVGLLGGFGGDVLWDKESGSGVVDPAETLASACLEHPVIGVEAA